MKHILTLQSDYSKNGSYIQLSLPIQTEYLIPVDDSVRLIDQVLDKIESNYGRRFDNLIADAGYESEENYNYLKMKKITCT